MKPATAGNRLADLRRELGATQEVIAELGGLRRVAIVRAEKNTAKWRSADLKEGLMRAYGMTYEQLGMYLDRRMSLHDAVALAKPTVGKAVKLSASRKLQDQALDALFERAGLQDEILQATKDAAREAFAQLDRDVPPALLVKRILAMNSAIRKEIDATVRALKSDLASPK